MSVTHTHKWKPSHSYSYSNADFRRRITHSVLVILVCKKKPNGNYCQCLRSSSSFKRNIFHKLPWKIKPVTKYFPTASECYLKNFSLTLTLSTEENILASSDTPPMYIFLVKTGTWSFSSFTSINTLAVLPKRGNGKYT